ncbi:MAG: guanosine-3',5'-bis(diphosphate) 3'-pyrophosphohydrolase [Burkholderiales bacterium PBB6]|nr:MAG: guanosine-3',5'-bis(diphosphate) 3'-pyrophosphohydrolase [Burkholderiales bacterium PBB6]
MSTLENVIAIAIAIAASAHAGQTDKGGQPYILHPMRVMLRLQSMDERIAGVPHDVIEDTPVTIEQLRKQGSSHCVLTALDALTKRQGETRLDAAARAAAHPVARAVKLADNAKNSDLSRIPNPTDKDLERMEEYRQVKQLLLRHSAA